MSPPLDTTVIPQRLLDLESRPRRNPFPWRGQFSPGLVDILLSTFATTGAVVFDPFAGVGTTLIESARRGLEAVGTEINPAAVAMAQTIAFIPLSDEERREWLGRVQQLIGAKCSPGHLAAAIAENSCCSLTRNVLTNVLIRVLASQDPRDPHLPGRAFTRHAQIILDLPHSKRTCQILDADARSVPVTDFAIDLVITSPPYINVFNYHQNSRKAMELIGCDLLHIAKSEIGSNRKNRMNRFLTVVQYCLDMLAALTEMRRVLKPGGRIITVIGRESTIRGVRLQNARIIARLAQDAGLKPSIRQERKFRNKFGNVIYEDLLHFERAPLDSPPGTQGARRTAQEALEGALTSDVPADVKSDICAALQLAPTVAPSPVHRSAET